MEHDKFMELALAEAAKAAAIGEVPIGAVIVKDGQILARAHNMREQWMDATAHAEVIAIREACEKLHNWRLSGCTLYVTVEPCPMCAGAIYNSRIDTVIFGCRDNWAGAVESLFNVLSHPLLNHQPQVIGGILEDRCAAVIKDFFASCR
ncbi:MAG: tRNA adenosine(34) deaminase TadA [Succiniclasticum sp.]|uniref:tRNA adenosine(34) deaminase TadA n=1 Tax=Succiniclasticum sp. TaxID=2775030 RepID=UPI002A910F8A|nr:tRNA adenosine(34) deaminase TadA [Succiniclasticum sp.]MDY6291831.1 tRNA adenosine(34) deaminase TadA [Succiniclasticum sp.]